MSAVWVIGTGKEGGKERKREGEREKESWGEGNKRESWKKRGKDDDES